MQEAVTKLAQRLRNVVSIRRKRARRGKFDSNDTLRKNLQYGGVPFRIVFDRKRKEKPQVMVLCDVSDSALHGDVSNVYARSDFWRSFKAFHRDFLPAVNKRTTVIILGDGRNNYNLPHDWVLKDVQQRAKQVIWLNPENKMTWGFGDSEMDRYAPYCTLVEECRNLNQLYHVIDRLVAV